MPKRLSIFTLLCIAAFAVVSARLFYWQIYKGRNLSVLARSQYLNTSQINAPRGDIFASDGSWFVASNEAWRIYASLPNIDKPPEELAKILAPLFVEDNSNDTDVLNEVARLNNLLSRKDVVWVPLKQKTSTTTKNKIEELDL
jgi:cell division protein FtsI/penicillin-binding protein 2